MTENCGTKILGNGHQVSATRQSGTCLNLAPCCCCAGGPRAVDANIEFRGRLLSRPLKADTPRVSWGSAVS